MAVSTGVPVNYGTGVKTALETTANATGGVVTVDGTATLLAKTMRGPAGSASAPTYSFSGDTNTGIFSTASDQLYTCVGGTAYFKFVGDGVQMTSTGSFRFNSGDIDSTADTWLKRGRQSVFSLEGASSAGGTFRSLARTATQLGADANNWAPGGDSYFIRASSDASRTITGLTFATTQVDGEVHLIVNVGSNNIVLANESASSTAANRFTNSTGADITLSAKQAADVVYDGTTSRWLVFKRN